jgi:hypothetical protein
MHCEQANVEVAFNAGVASGSVGLSAGGGGSTTNANSNAATSSESLARTSSTSQTSSQRQATDQSASKSNSLTATSSQSKSLNTGSTLSATYAGGQAYSTVVSSLHGNSQEFQSASSRFSKGLTTSYTQTVKRTYYKAALLVSELQQNSFSLAFRAAAVNVAQNPTPTVAKEFIFEFGNFVLDTATL